MWGPVLSGKPQPGTGNKRCPLQGRQGKVQGAGGSAVGSHCRREEAGAPVSAFTQQGDSCVSEPQLLHRGMSVMLPQAVLSVEFRRYSGALQRSHHSTEVATSSGKEAAQGGDSEMMPPPLQKPPYARGLQLLCTRSEGSAKPLCAVSFIHFRKRERERKKGKQTESIRGLARTEQISPKVLFSSQSWLSPSQG